MAQKYHPLDTRYTGPATAYTGKRAARQVAAAAPPPLPSSPAMTALPHATAEASPWGKARKRPAVLPPLPVAAPRRNSTLRVLVGIAVFVAIAGGLVAAMRSQSLLIHDIENSMRTISVQDF